MIINSYSFCALVAIVLGGRLLHGFQAADVEDLGVSPGVARLDHLGRDHMVVAALGHVESGSLGHPFQYNTSVGDLGALGVDILGEMACWELGLLLLCRSRPEVWGILTTQVFLLGVMTEVVEVDHLLNNRFSILILLLRSWLWLWLMWRLWLLRLLIVEILPHAHPRHDWLRPRALLHRLGLSRQQQAGVSRPGAI